MPADTAFAALEGAGVGLWEYDLVNKRARYDDAYCSLLGHTSESVAPFTEDYLAMVHPDDRDGLVATLKDRVVERKVEFEVEYRVKRGDGGWTWLEVRGKGLDHDEHGMPRRLIGTALDCSRRREAEGSRRKLEKQLAQVQRMESVGALVGGIAHDFNNVLLAIAGQTELAIADLEDEEYDEVAESLEEICSAAARAADMTRRLLSFGRQAENAWEVVDLVTRLRDLAPTLRRLVPASITFEIDAGDEPLWVHADMARIEQTLINLCANAVDATREHGEIRIRAGLRDVTPDEVSAYRWASPGRYVCVCVEDDGTGIPESELPRIFDPFFTTKKVGEGTGLGLSVAFATAKQHGGFMRVTTSTTAGPQRPRGSHFELMLPESARLPVQAGADDKQPAANGHGPTSRRSTGGAVILIAEDDAPVRRVVERMLEGAGYEVISAADGVEAVDLFREHEAKIDLVLLDAIMPNKTGREVYEEIARERPELKVMFASGYTADVLDHSFFERERRPLLSKPFSREVLLDTVAEVLRKN